MCCINSVVYDERTGILLMMFNFVYSTVSYPNFTFGHAMELTFEAYFVDSF